MSSNCSLLDVPFEETIGDENVTYVFHKEKHAKILLENLAEMQAHGLLTDMTLCTRGEDYEEEFHSMLLAACSPAVKRVLISRSKKGTKGSMALQELTKEILECLREFIYKSEVIVDKSILDDLNNFAVKYDIDVLVEMCGKLKNEKGRNPIRLVFDDQADVLSDLFGMFLEKELTMTVLEDQKGKTQFAVHGPLIAAASPALQEALLQGSSARERKKLRLEIPSIILGDLIGYIYSAKVILERANAVGLLRAGCMYEMPALAKACCDWLIPRLDTYDVVGILCLAQELDSGYTENLEEESKSYIIANFLKVSAEEEFNALGYEDLKEIIQNEKLDIEAEEDVFDVVMKWVEHDEETRLPHLSELLSCVRLEQTSAEFLQEIEQDPRIANSSCCLQVIEVARQGLTAADEQLEAPSESIYSDEGFQDAESLDDSSRHSEGTFLADNDGLSSASYSGAAQQVCLRDSYSCDSRHPDSHSRDNYQPASYSRDSCQLDSYSRDSYLPDRYSRDSYQPESCQLDSYLRDSYPCDSSHGSYQTNRYRTRKPGVRRDGQPDMRFKQNRELYLDQGVNVNGTPDKRFREARVKFTPPVKKDGTPDMRFKINKELLGRKGASASENRPRAVIPLNKDGTPDMRCKVNKEAFSSRRSTSSVNTPVSGTPRFSWELPLSSGYISRPLKNDGTPDMRYTVNKQRHGASSAAAGVSRGPLKKNGTPDMRYAVNRQPHTTTPSPSCTARGPLKKNGTPDMRFKANRR